MKLSVMASCPFELRALDAQLCIVEAHSGCPPGVDPVLCNALLAYRDVIEAIRTGIEAGRWSERTMPHSVKVLSAVPGLLQMPSDAAAALIADQCRVDQGLFYGDSTTSVLRKRCHTIAFRNRLVASLRKRARLIEDQNKRSCLVEL